MQNIRSVNTKSELIMHLELKKRKLSHTRNDARFFGKPDFVFRKYKTVLFIDSDFWHGNPKRVIMPKSNIEYWTNKIKGNILRDKLVTRTLKKEGWKVIRVWEYDFKSNPEKIMNRICARLIN